MSFVNPEVLNYKHPAVARRFAKIFPDQAQNAEVIFDDLMKFFYASKHHSLELEKKPQDDALKFTFIMDEEMKAIDDMWHVFLLYTQDYMEFCNKYFGEYLHHMPDIVPNNPEIVSGFEENLTKFLSYNYDLLGEEVVTRWFSDSVSSFE